MLFPYISQSGIAATVEGCALAPRPDGGYFLWYLSITGSAREAVRAIWAGLLSSTPRATTILFPAHPPQHALIQSAVWAAPRSDTDGWYTPPPLKLPRSAAYQLVMLPRIALLGHRPTPAPHPSTETTPGQPPQPPPAIPFVLLDTPERADAGLSMADYFLTRLNTAIDIPLLPQWADWAWQTCLEAGWISPLICDGQVRGAYLCRIDRAGFATALSAAIAGKVLGSSAANGTGYPDAGTSAPADVRGVVTLHNHCAPRTEEQKVA